MLYKPQAKQFSSLARQAAEKTREDYQPHWTEDSVTYSFREKLVNEFDNASTNRYLATANKVPDSYPNAAEQFVGADLLIVAGLASELGITGYGVMLQAKWERQKQGPKDILESLQDDCADMVEFSPCSYGLVYHDNSFRYFPAETLVSVDVSVFSNSGASLHRKIANRQTRLFLLPLLRGFAGDRWIFENLEEILDTSDKSLPARGAYTDGGEPPEDVDEIGSQAMVILFRDQENPYEGEIREELPFENEELLQGLQV